MTRLIVLVLLGCGSPAKPPVVAPPIVPPPSAPAPRVFTQLRVGTASAKRVTFELVIDGLKASLIETDQRGDRGMSLAQVDRALWTTDTTRTYQGTARGAELDLASAGVQPLHLHCVTRAIDAAAAGTLRVPQVSGDPCADHGVWQPAATAKVDALVCDAGAPDPDDDDLLVFGPRPGFEYVTVHEDCVLQGLRVAR